MKSLVIALILIPSICNAQTRLDLSFNPAAVQVVKSTIVPTVSNDSIWMHALIYGQAVCQVADLSTSQYLFGTGNFHEANKAFQPIANPVGMAIYKGVFATAITMLIVKWHTTHKKESVALGFISAGFGCGAAVYNKHLIDKYQGK